ncbi:MAG: hypothetical protein J6I50_09025 [Clostridia bacterium]|nr:hypothetical protein [Clostridia bacterium]
MTESKSIDFFLCTSRAEKPYPRYHLGFACRSHGRALESTAHTVFYFWDALKTHVHNTHCTSRVQPVAAYRSACSVTTDRRASERCSRNVFLLCVLYALHRPALL